MNQGRTTDALREFLHAAALDTTSSDIALQVARAYKGLGHADSSLAWATIALRRDDKNASAAFLAGLDLSSMGRIEDAAGMWRLAHQSDPASHDYPVYLSTALQQLAIGDLAQGKRARGKQRLQEAADLTPENPDPLKWLWKIAMTEDRPAEGDSLAARLLQLSPRDPEARVFQAVAWQRLGRDSLALALADSVFSADPGRRDAGMLVGLILEAKGKLQPAAEYLRRVLQRYPRDRDVRFRLGVILDQAGEIDSSLAVFSRLIAEDPDDARVLNHAGYVCIDRGIRLQEAMGWVQRAVEIEPNNPAYLDSYGWGWFRAGEPMKALEPLAKAAELDPQEILILKHLGRAQEAAGRTSQAEETFRRALRLDPKDTEIPVWLKQLGRTPRSK